MAAAVNIIGRLNILRFSKRMKKILRNDLTIVEEKHFDESYDDFWERVSQYLKISVVCGSEYLNWRYRDNPAYQYTVYEVRKNNQILGFTVMDCFREKYNVGRILEFLVLPN